MPGVQQDIPATHHAEADLVEYRAVSVTALLGLLLGFSSAAAFGHPIFWAVPVVGVFLNLLALRNIANHSPPLLGRGAAIVGLALSLALGAAAATQYSVSAARSRHEAQQLGRLWLEALANHNPELALELEQLPPGRLAPGEDLRLNYRDEPVAAKALGEFTDRPLIAAMIAAGPDAQIQYLETALHQVTLHKERIRSRWRVTYERAGEPTTFYVQILLTRELLAPRRVWEWRVEKSDFAAGPSVPAK
jgi:hypothetical protein